MDDNHKVTTCQVQYHLVLNDFSVFYYYYFVEISDFGGDVDDDFLWKNWNYDPLTLKDLNFAGGDYFDFDWISWI